MGGCAAVLVAKRVSGAAIGGLGGGCSGIGDLGGGKTGLLRGIRLSGGYAGGVAGGIGCGCSGLGSKGGICGQGYFNQ